MENQLITQGRVRTGTCDVWYRTQGFNENAEETQAGLKTDDPVGGTGGATNKIREALSVNMDG